MQLAKTLRKWCHVQMERGNTNMKVCQFWTGEFMSLNQKYEERVRKFSILARHYFKEELYCYIYIVIFRKHLSELYWIVALCSIFICSSIKTNVMPFFRRTNYFLPVIFHTILKTVNFSVSLKIIQTQS